MDERYTGIEYQHGYYGAATSKDGGLGFNAVVHHNLSTGSVDMHELPEGDGYLLSVLYRGAENRSDLAVFDAQNVADGPFACAATYAATQGMSRCPNNLIA